MKNLFLFLISLPLLLACDSKSRKPNVELIQNMMESPSQKAQDYDRDEQKSTMRLPPEHAVAIGDEPYRYSNDPQEAGKKLKNPFSSDSQVLKRGEERYNIYCSVCHGPKGLGNGSVAERFLIPPPSLVSKKIKDWSDGRIYHVITAGQGLMGSYASQVSEEDRWKIVNYIRQLQIEHKD